MSDILKALATLKSKKWIDLTHTVSPEIPYFPAFKPMEEKTLFTVDNDSFCAKEYTIVSQYGTHIDAPMHFANNVRSLEELPLKDFALPLFVIHKEDEVSKNHDYRLTVDDILAFEREHGTIPAESFVAFSSGWSERWHDHSAFYNKDADGQAHTPGWTIESLKFLHEERNVTAIGHETLDTDSALDMVANKDLICERYWLTQDKYQIEVMNNLNKLPATGAVIVIGVPKIKDAPGFGVRAFAIVEE